MKDSFLWYFIKEKVAILAGFIKYVIQEPRFWIGFGAGGWFILGVNAL